MNNDRPVTSKARGVCRYYNTPRGCLAGSSCKFLHGEDEKLTPYDKNKTCRYYAAGFCKRGADCWFRHVDPTALSSSDPSAAAHDAEEEEEVLCSICYETPITYGLLGAFMCRAFTTIASLECTRWVLPCVLCYREL